MSYHLIPPLFILIAVTLSDHLLADNTYSPPKEHWYQDVWCQGQGGMTEYRVSGGLRVDCLTDEYAIEMDFARKWSEAIGQSMEYSMLTEKKAGIVLILKKKSDYRYWKRLKKLIAHYQLPITVWQLGP